VVRRRGRARAQVGWLGARTVGCGGSEQAQGQCEHPRA
jgi:hypothetical protein